MSRQYFLRLFAAFALLSALFATSAPASAQAGTADLAVTVLDAATGLPLAVAPTVLVDEGEAPYDEFVVDRDGSGQLSALPEGSYQVRVVAGQGGTVVPSEPVDIDVVGGQNVSLSFTIDGEDTLLPVSGTVFEDLNEDGIRDANDGGLAGAAVNLVDAADVVVDSSVADADGSYTVLAAEGVDYHVVLVVADPIDAVLGGSTAVPVGTYASGQYSGVVPSASEPLVGYDFSIAKAPTARLKVLVVDDATGIVPLESWTLELRKAGEVVTSQTRSYAYAPASFNGIAGGDYEIAVLPITGSSQTEETVQLISIENGSIHADLEIRVTGAEPAAAVSGTIFLDTDEDGEIDDGEIVPSLNLGPFGYFINPDGTPDYLRTSYPSFWNQANGDYVLYLEPGQDYRIDSNGPAWSELPESVNRIANAASGEFDLLNFGYVPVPHGNVVGTVTDVATGVPAAHVRIEGIYTWARIAFKDADGNALSSRTLPFGLMRFNLESVTTATTWHYTDSDGVTADGVVEVLDGEVTEIEVLVSGKPLVPTVTGFVYADENENGVKDDGEQGIEGVRITAEPSESFPYITIDDAITAADGSYHFYLDPNIDFDIAEVQPDGWIDGAENSSPPAGTVTDDGYLALQFGPDTVTGGFDFAEIPTPPVTTTTTTQPTTTTTQPTTTTTSTSTTSTTTTTPPTTAMPTTAMPTTAPPPYRGVVKDALSIDQVVHSTDYDKADHAELLRLYQAIFGRYPDLGGVKYWIDINNQGHDVLEIAGHMTISSEWRNNFQGVNDEDFLTRVYTNVLGRNYDQGGYNYWLDTLRGTNQYGGNPESKKLTRHEVVFYVTANPEFTNAYPFQP